MTSRPSPSTWNTWLSTRGLASRLAENLGGPCYTLGQLHAELLYKTVRQEIDTPR